jgi:hypothetical protein
VGAEETIAARYGTVAARHVPGFSFTSAPAAHDQAMRICPSSTAVAVAALLAGVGAACGSDEGSDATAVIDPGDGGDYSVELDPAEFTSVVDNPYLPMLPGTRWVYESTDVDGETERIVVEVLDETRSVMGVEAIVVHDVVEVDGEVIEDTYDWFAQDAAGNVWYFGEDTTAYEDGVADTSGAWEAGVDGALPGIVMLADPAVSDTGYRQEYFPGEAEDMGQVIAVGGSVSVPVGDFEDVVVTRDWTPLEADVVEEKTYAPAVGFVREIKTAGEGTGEEAVLVEYTPPS